MSVLQKLTEGVQHRDMQAEGAALLNKWEATGLLEGLNEGQAKQGMAVLLENQAKELLREASSMAAGDVEGFAAVAFPIVRRVFGGLIANDLISVQPMSLPSGLIFFLDFTREGGLAGEGAGASLYGGGAVGKEIVDGISLDGSADQGGFYSLSTGYSAAHGDFDLDMDNGATAAAVAHLDGSTRTEVDRDPDLSGKKIIVFQPGCSAQSGGPALGQIDPGVAQSLHAVVTGDAVGQASWAGLNAATKTFRDVNGDILHCSKDTNLAQGVGNVPANGSSMVLRLREVRRHTKYTKSTNASTGLLTVTAVPQVVFEVVSLKAGSDIEANTAGNAAVEDAAFTLAIAKVEEAASTAVTLDQTTMNGLADALDALTIPMRCSLRDQLGAGGGLGSVIGADVWALEEPSGATGNSGSTDNKNEIAEIDIKVDSIAVTAQTKKLKAKWSPELGQDLNAYHNLDAEVELTGILSEQIALEIDRELLGELVAGATAGKRYWSRAPGLFVNSSGTEVGASSAAPDFTGTVSEWYETLIETINDVSAQIHRKTLRGGANFVVCSPEVANILEFTSGFRASVTADQDRGTIGAVKAGSLSKKFDVYVDPYFIRNVVLVGRKGSSFLESGYVYAPYVPLQVTPTIFGTEDFVPRKGVMTRYAKKMVRPDMYGLVIVRGLLGESGATS